MNLVKEGFLSELATGLELGEVEHEQQPWWLGRIEGLHEAGLLTKEERNHVSYRTSAMFAATKIHQRNRDHEFEGRGEDEHER